MIKIKVETEPLYNVYINGGLLSDSEFIATELKSYKKLMVVTDSNVAPLYLRTLLSALKTIPVDIYSYVVEAGELSKSIDSFSKILSYAVECGLTRGDAFIALGGGVVGDLTGFIAANYMRGVDFYQVPTTLLAAIDSSVGGKTAINLPEGKNLVGAFHQPRGVFFDIDTLKTLPEEEWKCGLGEAIKYAALAGGRIYDIISDGVNDDNIQELIALCIEYKAMIVKSDEKDDGIRKILNLGHTVGHAIEKLSGFTIKHGVAVAQGLQAIVKYQTKEGSLSRSEANKLSHIIDKYHFSYVNPYPLSSIVGCISKDKKSLGGGEIELIKLKEIGKPFVENVKIETLGALL